MNYQAAISILEAVESDRSRSNATRLESVSPVVQTIVSAAILHGDKRLRNLGFASEEARTHAQQTGFLEALDARAPVGERGALHGKTYSRLTKLAWPVEVDECNRIIADLVVSQLGRNSLSNRAIKCIGELHDNVASHARGAAFSSAQIYGGKRLQFSVADFGCGMLSNVVRKRPEISNDADAIAWCLEAGNTTWIEPAPLEQRSDHFAIGLGEEDNYHCGEGLSLLRELVLQCDGQAWIWSGRSALLVNSDGTQVAEAMSIGWKGVAIELELSV